MRLRLAIRFSSIGLALTALAFGLARPTAAADSPNPPADAKAFQKYFTDKFPKVKLEDFVNGPYSMDEGLYKQWKEKEEFPPYEFAPDAGERRLGQLRVRASARQATGCWSGPGAGRDGPGRSRAPAGWDCCWLNS